MVLFSIFPFVFSISYFSSVVLIKERRGGFEPPMKRAQRNMSSPIAWLIMLLCSIEYCCRRNKNARLRPLGYLRISFIIFLIGFFKPAPRMLGAPQWRAFILQPAAMRVSIVYLVLFINFRPKWGECANFVFNECSRSYWRLPNILRLFYFYANLILLNLIICDFE